MESHNHKVTYVCNCDGPDRIKATFRTVETYRDGVCMECHYVAVAKIVPVATPEISLLVPEAKVANRRREARR